MTARGGSRAALGAFAVVGPVVVFVLVVFVGEDVAFVGEDVVFVGQDVVFVGQDVVFVGEDVAFVGEDVAFVGEDVAFVGEDVAFVGEDVAFVGEDVAFVGEDVVFVGQDVVEISTMPVDSRRFSRFDPKVSGTRERTVAEPEDEIESSGGRAAPRARARRGRRRAAGRDRA